MHWLPVLLLNIFGSPLHAGVWGVERLLSRAAAWRAHGAISRDAVRCGALGRVGGVGFATAGTAEGSFHAAGARSSLM